VRALVTSSLRAVAVVALVACTPSRATAPNESHESQDARDAAASLDAGVAEPATHTVEVDASTRAALAAIESRFTVPQLAAALFRDRPDTARAIAAACPTLRCVYDQRFSDAQAAELAWSILETHGVMTGVEVAHKMDGGYRGLIELVPAVPVGADRKHIEWIARALDDIGTVFEAIRARTSSPASIVYRSLPDEIRFTRSLNKHTPAAYAFGTTITYNLEGSINTGPDAVRETFVHEIFHLNDEARGWWSQNALAADFNRVAARCKQNIPCLKPFSPGDTIVRGGTYYAFQPGNGVTEYAAELMLRYYRETRLVVRGEKVDKPFKCGEPENARTWGALVREFMGGVDLVPPC
jgi:hypothetical protein